jgi:glycosyltransferase involved in cell wall biosynthesis
LHVVPYFPPSQAGGGIRETALCLARAQARAGCRVTVCTTDVGTPRSRRPPTEGEGFKVLAFPNVSNTLAWNDITLPIGIARWARHNVAAFDAVHLHGHRHLAALIVGRARRSRPYVLSPHGTAKRIERRIGVKRLYDSLAGEKILHGAARVIAVSGAEESQLLSLGVDPESIRLLPNPVDPAAILPIPEKGAFRKRHGIPPDSRVVIFLGRVTPNKRVDVLLRALTPIPDVFLVVAGPDGGALEVLRRAAAAAGINKRVILAGPLGHQARRELLADADLLALPSRHEIFGLAPMEGLLAGVAPVVSRDTGCAERIRAWNAGWLADGGDADALGSVIRCALDDQQASRERAARGADAVRRNLSPGKIAARMLEIYSELVVPSLDSTAGREGGR